MHERKRLHISPFNPELLPIILPGDLFHRASNISFHQLQTYQERNYGYVDLPVMDADKIKKKLNGSILKGSKMRIEEAKPEKPKKALAGSEALVERDPLSDRGGRGRRKKEKVEGVIPGVELPEGRKVRRGWTEPMPPSKTSKSAKFKKEKDAKKSKLKPSSFTKEPECLFKTKLPPNVADIDAKPMKRKREHSGRDVVVHEFANTTKHASFLRNHQALADSKGVSEYVEGKGWIDQQGNIIEEVRKMQGTQLSSVKDGETRSLGRNAPSHHFDGNIPNIRVSDAVDDAEEQGDDDVTSSSGTSSSSASDTDSGSSPASPRLRKEEVIKNSNVTSKSPSEAADEDAVSEQARALSRSNLSSSTSSASPYSTTQAKTPAMQVHPLEALFKRPKLAASSTPRKPALEVSTSFNFFDPDVDEGTNTGLLIPRTPFTQQDFRERCQRSAAPTPDTAAPGKTFGNVWASQLESEDNEEIEVGPVHENATREGSAPVKGNDGEAPESDFSKWFWEHRGETNRAWKRRRREAAKEKRQRDHSKS